MASQNGPSHQREQTGSWLVCNTCGTQFPTANRLKVTTCFICDDPRQYVPASGQSFTTLDALRAAGHKNEFSPIAEGLIAIRTEPKFAIGQRAILVAAPFGNVLWDCITLLDDDTIAKITELGGLKAIVISHPHYYSTHLEWAHAFNCRVYLAAEDNLWLAQRDAEYQVFLEDTKNEVHGVSVLKLGGHFPGSSVLLAEDKLLIADTFFPTPSGLGNWDANAMGVARKRPAGMSSFSFMRSYPNMIPLGPDELAHMWGILKQYHFTSTHGAFPGGEIVAKTGREMRQRVLESMQIQLKHSGHAGHAFLKETNHDWF